ncbi:hypothetical protein BGP_2890 [Beggiatoa sp. PS]|nr:hypothetical protein BGP_2890 [Beggiatoa sp. PS]
MFHKYLWVIELLKGEILLGSIFTPILKILNFIKAGVGKFLSIHPFGFYILQFHNDCFNSYRLIHYDWVLKIIWEIYCSLPTEV